MATSRNHFVTEESNPERRRNPRVAPTLLTYVSFGGSNGGMVLDVSEDGLALATALAVPDKQLLNIAIPSDQAHQLIEVTGRVVWISESKRRVGLQLVEPSPSSREFLRKWVATVMQRQPAGPSVPKIDAESWNAAGIVENCAPLPIHPLASEGVDEPETQLTLDLLGTAEPLVTERPQPRGALLMMVANSATHMTQAAATQTATEQSFAMQTPETETLTSQISALQIPIGQISETQIFETGTGGMDVPETNCEGVVPEKEAETEVVSSEVAEEELAVPAAIPFAAEVPEILDLQPSIQIVEPSEIFEPHADAAGLNREEEAPFAMATAIPLTPAEDPIRDLQPVVETLELPVMPAEPGSSEATRVTNEEEISFVSAIAPPVLHPQSPIEPFELAGINGEPSAELLPLPSEEEALLAPAASELVVEEGAAASPAAREVRDLLLSLESAESEGTAATIPLRIASKGPAKTGPASSPMGSSPMSSSLLLASAVVVAVSFATGILIGRGLLTKIFSDPATNVDTARPALLARGKPSTHASGSASSAVTTKIGVTAVPAGPSTAPASVGGAGAHAVTSNGNSNGDSNGAAIDKNKSAAEAAATPAGIEMMVTPNEGDAPLRVDLPEETVVQSTALEIRAERFLYVPGAGPQRSRKVRKERVVVGPLLSRVTPPELADGARSGEQVVTVRATIEGDGHVSYVDPLDGPIALIPSVMTAVRGWRFAPSSLNREPLKTEVDLTVKFRARQ